MPFGYFPNKCYVQNTENLAQKVYLIGSSDNSVKDRCTGDVSKLLLNVVREPATWTSTDFTLDFDAFKFGDSTKLSLTCDFEVCLTSDCETESAQTC